MALQPTLDLLGGNLAQYGQPDPHYPSVPRRGCAPPSLLDATRVLLSKGRPSGPVPRGSPLPHPAITAPMRYSSNRQKVLRFCGAMVTPGPTLSASRAAASADQPFRRPPHSGVSLLPGRDDRQRAPSSAATFRESRRAARRGPIAAGDITRGRPSAANQSGTLHLRGGAGSQSDSRTAAVAAGQWEEETSEVRAARKRLRTGES